jgi:excisionase family DNA binding protein
MERPALAYSVPQAGLIANAGRTSIYEAISSGQLRAVKRGRRTLILDEDLRRWLHSLPQIEAKASGKSDRCYFGQHDRDSRRKEMLTVKTHVREHLP